MANIKQGGATRDERSNKFAEESEAIPCGLARKGTKPLEEKNVIEVSRHEESARHNEELASNQ